MCARRGAGRTPTPGCTPTRTTRPPSPTRTPSQCAAVLAEVLREERADVLTDLRRQRGLRPPGPRPGPPGRRPRCPARRHARRPGGDRSRAPVRRRAAALWRSSGIRSAAPPRWAPARSSRTRRASPTGSACAATRSAASARRWPPTGRSDEAGTGDGRWTVSCGCPLPVFWLVFGREWYVEHGRRAPDRLDDVFVSLRGTRRADEPDEALRAGLARCLVAWWRPSGSGSRSSSASAIGVLLALGLVLALCWVVRLPGARPGAPPGPHPLTVRTRTPDALWSFGRVSPPLGLLLVLTAGLTSPAVVRSRHRPPPTR